MSQEIGQDEFVIESKPSSVKLFRFLVFTNLKRAVKRWQNNLFLLVVLPVLVLGFFRWVTLRPNKFIAGSLDPQSLPPLADICRLMNCSVDIGIIINDPVGPNPSNTPLTASLTYDSLANLFGSSVKLQNFASNDSVQSYNNLISATRGDLDSGNFDVGMGIIISTPDGSSFGPSFDYQLVGRQSVLYKYGHVVQAYIEDYIINTFRQSINMPTLQSTDEAINIIPIPFTQRNSIAFHCLSVALFIYAIACMPILTVTNDIAGDRGSGFRQITELAGLTPANEILSIFVGSLVKIAILALVFTGFFFADTSMDGSNPFFVYVFVFVGLLAQVSFGMLLSFRLNSVSGISSLLIVFFIIHGYGVKEYFIDGPDSAVPLIVTWILPPSSFSLGFAYMQQTLLLQDNLSVFSDANSLGYFVKLLVQTIFYFFLAIYLDSAIPGFTYVVRQSPFFFFTPQYWKEPPTPIISTGELSEIKDTVLQIRLDKNTFGVTTLGINNVHADCFGGSATAMLGHNGAGKTTLISLLTGIRKINKGFVRFIRPTEQGNEVLDLTDHYQLVKFTRQVGFCPQHNALTPELSIYEHLELVAKIRGITRIFKKTADADGSITLVPITLKEYIYDLVGKLDFQKDSIHKPSSGYSGGMLRKTSLALALLGEPSVIVLDEFTTSMDIFVRTKIWAMINRLVKSPSRIVLFSSHDMEEAATLGDSVMVIAGGILQEHGTPISLNDKFSRFIRLHVRKSASFDKETFQQFLASTFAAYGEHEEVFFRSETETTVSFTVPKVPYLSAVVKNITIQQKRFGITDVDLSAETLEEVFLRITEAYERNLTKEAERMIYHELVTDEEVEALKQKETNLESVLIRQQWSRLIKFRVKKVFAVTDGGEAYSSIFRVIIMMFFTMFLSGGVRPSPNGLQPVGVNPSGELIQFIEHYPVNISALLLSPPVVPILDYRTIDDSILYSRMVPTAAFNVSDTNFPLAQFLFTAPYSDSVPNIDAVLACVESANYWVANSSYDSGQNLPCSTGFMINSWNFVTSKTFPSYGVNTSIVLVLDDLSEPFLNLQQWLDMIGTIFDLIQSVTKVVNIPLLAVNEFNAGKLVNALNVAKSGVPGLTLTYSYYRFWDNVDHSSFTKLILPLISLAQSLVFLMIMSKYQREYQSRLGHHMQVHGLSNIQYALSHVVGALIIMLIHLLISFGLLLIVPAGSANSSKVFGSLALVQLTMAVSVVFLIALSDKFGPIVFTIFNAAIYLSIFFWSVIRSFTPSTSIIAIGVSVLNPLWSLYEFFFAIFLNQTSPVPSNNPQIALGIQSAQFVISVIGAIFLLWPRERTKILDVDERSGLHSGLSVTDLEFDYSGKKTEQSKRVLRGVSFDVRVGESYGLLGTNGCGKSTTMKCILGQNRATSGHAYVNEKSVIPFNMANIHGNFGYCPQDDSCLSPSLTIRDHLNFYCALKRVPPSKRARLVEQMIEVFSLPFSYPLQMVATLSGGTRRKLSLALAYLANPNVVFADEPTSGVDVKARAAIWKSMNEFKLRSAVILTTHSMDEADFLSTKVGFLVNGKIGVEGDPTQIKAEMSSSYDLFLRVSTEKIRKNLSLDVVTEGAIQFVRASIDPNATVLKKLEGSLEIIVALDGASPAKTTENSASLLNTERKIERIIAILETLEAARDSGAVAGLVEFSLSQRPLTSVFLDYLKANGGSPTED
ncbi:hypothetical protein HK100_003189 [Physocladia obscura]|uniref:ABC transporter domain-containing protein n=1 Tax=Physocladia obscura TaxID=109957 RepID=A0AAD5T7T1_9FUNG|nr:hypothetical protein HK100_003189 [Physocladia obscura]